MLCEKAASQLFNLLTVHKISVLHACCHQPVLRGIYKLSIQEIYCIGRKLSLMISSMWASLAETKTCKYRLLATCHLLAISFPSSSNYMILQTDLNPFNPQQDDPDFSYLDSDCCSQSSPSQSRALRAKISVMSSEHCMPLFATQPSADIIDLFLMQIIARGQATPTVGR